VTFRLQPTGESECLVESMGLEEEYMV